MCVCVCVCVCVCAFCKCLNKSINLLELQLNIKGIVLNNCLGNMINHTSFLSLNNYGRKTFNQKLADDNFYAACSMSTQCNCNSCF